MSQNEFFLIIPPGLEQLVTFELLSKWPHIQGEYQKFFQRELPPPKIDPMKGGIEVTTELEGGLFLNNFLKGPTRILMRIESFKAKDFPKFFQKCTKIDWKKYLNNQRVDIKATAKNCKLIHSGRLQSTLENAINEYFIKSPAKVSLSTKPNLSIYLRGQDDVFTISCDVSGEALYKRSNTSFAHPSPLRENMASMLLKFCEPYWSEVDLLVDPMCGTGTFPLEASEYFSLNKGPFAYEESPLFNHKRFLLKKLRPVDKNWPINFIGRDINNEYIESLQNQYPQMSWQKGDFFDYEGETRKFMIIANLPYGERLKNKVSAKKFLAKCADFSNCCYVGILTDDNKKVEIADFSLLKQIGFDQGGKTVYFSVYKNLVINDIFT